MKKYLSVLLVLLLILGMLAGCGASSEQSYKTEAAMPMAAPAATMAMTEAVPMEEALYDSIATDAENGTVAMPMDQKLIRTVYIDSEVRSMNALLAWMDGRVAELNGYYEQKSVYRRGSRDDGSFIHNGDFMIRIPVENLDQFITAVGEQTNITSTRESTENVTLTYVSTKSRVEALEVEQQRLLELLENAETMEDLLNIEARLTDVRWELENYASQLRVLENQVAYSTIHLNVWEVDEPTIMAERTVWQKIGDGFAENTVDLWEGIVDTFVWFISSLPFLIPIALVAVLGFKFGKKLKAKKAKKKEEPQA